jgi:hypothetical protein
MKGMGTILTIHVAPPQKAVKIMRRSPNVSGRNYSSASGGSGDRAQTDKTLEERETEYAKARARIFNENPPSTTPTEKQTTSNSSNNTSTNNGSSGDSNVTITDDNANSDTNSVNNNTTNSTNPTNTNNTKDQSTGSDAGVNASQKRNTASTAPTKSRRGFSHDGAIESMHKYPDVGFSDMSFYSQDIAPYRDKVTYNPKDHTLSLNDGGLIMDGKDRCVIPFLFFLLFLPSFFVNKILLHCRMPPYPIGHFDPDGLFAGNIDSYMAGHPLRFDGYEFSDYAGTQEVPNAWAMPPHPGFYGFGRGAGYMGDGMMGKGDNSFYFDFAPPVKGITLFLSLDEKEKEWRVESE